MRAHYPNLFTRKNEAKYSTDTQARIPGWNSDGKTKELLLSAYRDVLGGDFVERSMATLTECKSYIMTPARQIVHQRSRTSLDPTQVGEGHGDCVIASALLWRGIVDVCGSIGAADEEQKPRTPVNSMAGRRRAAERERQMAEVY